jgi:hypothetical protein
VLGVGVDYALFIVTRHRRNLRRGMSVRDSIVAAINTSGRAVLFAGTTVCIAMLGLTALGVSFFYGMAVGTAIAVSLTMLAALTLLPALLSFLGLRVLRRKERRAVLAGNFVDIETVGFWARWSELVARRRVAFGVVGAVIVVALAIPFLALRLGHDDQGNDPAGTTTRKGYDLIAQGFGPGYNSTLTLVVDGPQAQATAETVGTALARVPNVDTRSIFVPTQGLREQLSLVSFKSLSAPQDEKTTQLVNKLRNDVLPPLYNGTGDHVYVFGMTATQVDFTDVLSSKLPLFIAAVVGLSFLLLMIAFRSLLVPMTAAAMNLLAAGASFGDRRRDLPVGLVRGGTRHRQGRSDRGLGPGHGLRDHLRPVHGLPGIPGQPDARGVGADARQPAGGQGRPGRDRRHHHRSRSDHDRCVPRIRARPEPCGQIVRSGLGRRGAHRRIHPAHGPGALADAHVRSRQLGIPTMARPHHPTRVRGTSRQRRPVRRPARPA